MSARDQLATLAPGTMIDHFRIMRLAGRGAYAVVYLARDTLLGRRAALKIFSPKVAVAKEAVDQFLIEARATAAFSHPHIVTVYGVGEIAGRPYVALEYLEGRTLRQRIMEDPPSAKESMRILLAIANALEEAHARKILHRDLKPENIIIPRDGRIRVVDFGLATMARAPEVEKKGDGEGDTDVLEEMLDRQPESWRAVGTPAYMAPEQWTARVCSPATDIWALGVLARELLVGHRPFVAETREELGRKVIGNEPPPPIPRSAQLTPELVELIDRALDRLPDYRPAAREFVAALEAALFPGRASGASDRSPFRGLLAFGERHADIFFGRDAEVTSFVERLRERPVLPVIGPSGAGKSSFVQAGVIPQLRDQGRWIILRMRPGYRPFEALATRLLEPEVANAMGTSIPRSDGKHDDSAATGPAMTETGEPLDGTPAGPRADLRRVEQIARLAAKLRAAPLELGLALRALAERENARVLLFVDQLEELHTLTSDVADRKYFIEAISSAADDAADPVRVVFTVRDDFVGKVAAPGEAFTGAVLLRAPDESALLEILTRPLAHTEYRYEDENIPRQMIREVGGEPAALPLLQFAGQSLWDHRDRSRKLLLRSSYDAMGGVAGALASHADGILASLGADQRKDARQIFLRLITAERTRRILAESRALEGLGSGAREVLDRLIEARLLTTRRSREDNRDGEADLELAHESLVDTWQTLSRWIEESKDERAFLSQIGRAAELWEQRGSPADEVWQGDALATARVELAKLSTPIPAGVARFVAAGEAERRRRVVQRRGLTLAAFVIVSLAAISFYSGKEKADAERRVAELRRAEALREGGESALSRGEVWEARAKLRTSLELADSSEARASWIRLLEARAIWRRTVPRASQLAFAPDGKLVVQAEEQELHEFDLKTFEERSISGVKSGAYSLAYSPSGKFFAIGAGSGEVELRDRGSGAKLALTGHRAPVHRLSFGPGEKMLLSTSWDHTARLWSLPSGAELAVLEGHTDRVYGGEISRDGELIATSSWDKTIRIWSTSTHATLRVLPCTDKVVDLSFSADSKRLVSGSEDGTISVWDPRSGVELQELRGHVARVSRVLFHPDGMHIFSASWDGTVRAWSADTGRDRLASSGGPALPGRDPLTGRDRLASSGGPALPGRDPLTGRELAVVATHSAIVQTVELDPARGVFASLSHDGEVRISRADSPEEKAIPPVGPLPGVAIDPEGMRIASTAPDHAIAVWEARTGELERVLTGHTNTLRALAFGPRGKLLASGGFDSTVRIWDVETGAVRQILMGHTRPVSAVAFFPDGERVASGAFDHTARIWSLKSGVELAALDHGARITALAVSADGSRVATAAFDGTIGIWDGASGTLEKKLSCGAERIVHQVAFSASGAQLAALCGPTVRVWKLGGEFASRDIPGAGNSSENFTCLAFDPTAERIAHSVDGGGAFTELVAGTRMSFEGAKHEHVFCAFDAYGRSLVTIDDDGAVRLRDAKNGRPLWRAPFFELGPAPDKPWRAAQLGSRSADEKFACAYFDDGRIELWDLAAEARIAERRGLEGVTDVVAFGDGCLIAANGKALLFDRTGAFRTIEDGATAIAAGREHAWAAKRGSIIRFDPSGQRLMTTPDELDQPSEPTAIGLGHDGRALAAIGFADGSLHVFPAGRTLESVSKSAVTRIVEGPRGSLIAGQDDGTVTVRAIETGALLLRFHLHGPVRHLVLESSRLHAVTELGSKRTVDLSALELEYCAFLKSVWDRAPAIWASGAARPKELPGGHPCFGN